MKKIYKLQSLLRAEVESTDVENKDERALFDTAMDYDGDTYFNDLKTFENLEDAKKELENYKCEAYLMGKTWCCDFHFITEYGTDEEGKESCFFTDEKGIEHSLEVWDIAKFYWEDEDREKVINKIEKDNSEFMDLNEDFQDDLEIAMLAIKDDGTLLEYASDRLQDNEELVKLAISDDSGAFEFASYRLRDNKEIAKTAILDWHKNFDFVSNRLSEDKELLEIYNKGNK